jgi:hypothetical protein
VRAGELVEVAPALADMVYVSQTRVVPGQQTPERALSLDEGTRPQVLSVHSEQIEGKEVRPVSAE